MESEPTTIDAAVLIQLTMSAAASIAATKGIRIASDVEEGVSLTTRTAF